MNQTDPAFRLSARARRWALLIVLLALIVGLAGVRAYRQHLRSELPTLGARPVPVHVAEVREGRLRRELTFQGQVRAAEAADLAPEVTAQVTARYVEPGDRVEAGVPLLRLDATALSAEARRLAAELAAARAEEAAALDALTYQERTLERDRALFAAGIISQEALERSELALLRSQSAARAASRRSEAVEEALAGARDREAKALLVAPWAGTVVGVSLAPGDLARAGVRALRLVREGPHRVIARLDPETARQVVPGSPAVVAARGDAVPASIARVAGGLDAAGLVAVEIDLPAAPFGLSDGAAVTVVLELEAGEGLIVPRRALLEGAPGPTVFVYREGVARAVPVEVLIRGGEEALVRGNLTPADSVVVEHPSVLMQLAGDVPVRLARPPGEEVAP
jgi:HlyD family secretion protein